MTILALIMFNTAKNTCFFINGHIYVLFLSII